MEEQMRKIKILDTTLRDGEQTPGVNLNIREKIEIAKQLAAMGVDIIEAGFPAASTGDFDAVEAIAKELKGVQICGLCRAISSDIQRAWEALRFAESPMLHIFIATSERHMLYKLKMSEEDVIEHAVKSVKLAKYYCDDVEFTAEDASRSDPDFLCRIVEKVIAAGATVINLPDTVGYAVPHEYASLIRYVKEHTPNIDKARISVHCHNDLGMAVANSLAGICAGADQVEGTFNGIGERAGNAALEEVIMSILTRSDHYKVETSVDTTQIYNMSRLISNYTGLEIPPGKAIVGDNAFRHESGIHQHGVLNNRETYEIMAPESIGRYDFNHFILGKLSGSHAFREVLAEQGIHMTEDEAKVHFEKFKMVADRKKEVTLRDILAIVEDRVGEAQPTVELANYQILSTSDSGSTATVSLNRGGEILQKAAIAGGPIDAAYKAITEMLDLDISLESYNIKAVTEGADALGEVTVRVRYKKEVYLGRGVSTDIIMSSLLAYLNAINRIFAELLFISDKGR